MRLDSLQGKLTQLRHAPFALWPEFVGGWLNWRQSETVPCLLPGCRRAIRVPLKEFYESYFFFCENRQGCEELKYFVDRLKPNDVLYDIGGFRGAYSAAAKAKWGAAVSVHIFEPLPPNLESLRTIAALNAFSQFRINPLAVGDGQPVVGRVNETDGMLRLGDATAAGENQFASISIDDYVAQGNPAPSILKIDVDGFELQVLAGAARCLQQPHPRLWLEVHPTFLKNQGKSVAEVMAWLNAAGYQPVFFDDYSPGNETSYHVWCE